MSEATQTATDMATNAGEGVKPLAVEPKPTAAEILAEITAFLSKSDFDLAITLPIWPQTVVLPCRIAMTTDEIDARIKFYSQPAEAQKTGQQTYHAEFMSSVLTGKPIGLPGFDALAEATGANDLPAWKDLLKQYLSIPGDNGAMFGSELVEGFNRATKPVEFFR